MNNRNMTFRALVEQMQHNDKVRAAFARVCRGEDVNRLDAGVLRTLANGAR